MVVNFGRNLDTGKFQAESVSVNDMDTLIEKVKAITQQLEEVTEQLRDLQTATDIIVGQETPKGG